MEPLGDHEQACRELARRLDSAARAGVQVRLKKSTSNLFRRRTGAPVALDVRRFNRVLRVDPQAMLADVEGMATYETVVKESLRHGLLPAVVPQLKTITVGGAVSGLGIESSSFRFGLVHETVEEVDVLLADGRIAPCSRAGNEDLFYTFPNSYGTLGYALRLKIRLVPAGRYVFLTHARFTRPEPYFARISELCASRDIDYLDGTVFGRGDMYITTGQMRDSAPYTSDYTYMRIYYRSIRERAEDWLTAAGYIWRWDTDWFWCSRQFGLQHPAVRLFLRPALNSRTYQRIMRLSQKCLPARDNTESVIQDVDIPVEHAAEFLEFLLAAVGITPIWICPFRAGGAGARYVLYALDPNRLYVNFGFWDVLPAAGARGHYNRKIEQKALELGGKKGLYSSAYYDAETFWRIHGGECYFAAKRRYDPRGVFPDLYAKCVGGR